ncbi:MAG: dockerin type I repeat-containing protein, partial [bacterium]
KWTQNGWLGYFHTSSGGPWPSDLHPILFDMDDNTMTDAVFGGSSYSPYLSKSHIFHFEDSDIAEGFQWEEEDEFFKKFNNTDTLFTFPVLVDIDNDKDFDLMLKRDSLFTFYENKGRVSHPVWTRNEKLLEGVGNLNHYMATFTDLDLDGDYDLVFGEEDGTLSCYVNIGNKFSPLWQENPSVFEGIDVGQNCAPVFGDMDNDGDLDLVVGNKEGWTKQILYFENRSFEDCVKGDINCDGTLDVADVLLCVSIIIKLHKPNRFELKLADFNGDARINVLDVVGIVRAIFGMP